MAAHRFKKGQVANPRGRPKNALGLPAIKDLLKARANLSASDLKSTIISHLAMSEEQISDVLTNDAEPVMNKIIARAITMALGPEGHTDKAEFLLRRAYGAVPQQVKVTATTKGMTVEQKLEAGRQAIAYLEAKRLEESKTIEGEVVSE